MADKANTDKENKITVPEGYQLVSNDVMKQMEVLALLDKQREEEIRATHLEYGNTRLTPVTREEFLQKFRETGNVSLAAALVGVNRVRVYQLRKTDKAFAKEWEEAREIGLDNIEHEGKRRAVEGTVKPVYYKGVVCGYIREYSDKLLEMLLRGRRGRVYDRNIADLPPGSEIIIAIKTGDGKEGQPIDVTPKQTQEEQAITD